MSTPEFDRERYMKEAGLVDPLTRITLKKAVEGRSEYWVTQDPESVARWVNDPKASRTIEFTQVVAMKPQPVWIAPDQVRTIEPLEVPS